MTAYEAAGRNKKAAALIAKAIEFGITANDADSSLYDGKAWDQLAREAGVKEPSFETRRLVVARLREAEQPEPECVCRQTDVDQFDSRDCPLHSKPRPSSTPMVMEDAKCPF